MKRFAVIAFYGVFLGLGPAMPKAHAQTQPALLEQYQDWTFRCFTGPQSRCELFQNRINPQTKQPVFWVEWTRHLSGKEELAIITPLGSRVADGLTLSVDGAFSWTVAIRTCVPVGCMAQININKVLLNRIMRGKILIATLTSLSGDKVPMQISLAGFAKGYARLESQIKLR